MDDSCQSIDRIIHACRHGDIGLVEQWVAHGGNPNQIDAQGWTPLLAGCVRGQIDVVRMLLAAATPAVPDLPFMPTGALAIHFAGQSGSIAVAESLLDARPEHLDKVWLLNGHTLLLQAVFYGHVDLTRWALDQGANAAATTVRGLAAMELAAQFENQTLIEVIRPHDPPSSAKESYLHTLLGHITPFIPYAQRERQELVDRLVESIQAALPPKSNSGGNNKSALALIRNLLNDQLIDLNGLGGLLQQPPLVAAVTGNDGQPPRAEVTALRHAIVRDLLDRGADPTRRERHPMAVNAIIRAAVFGHLEILKDFSSSIGIVQMAKALNEQPAVNGLTALHDSVLRASTTDPQQLERYLAQIRWFTDIGARSDIEDFAGRTQAKIAQGISDVERRSRILSALGLVG